MASITSISSAKATSSAGDAEGTASPLKVTSLAGSQAAYDLGISGGAIGAVLDGTKIITDNTVTDNSAGLGFALTNSITKLIDPVNGVLTRENKTLDDRTTQFKDRIAQLDALLTAKRTRLETQFANMESVLAGLQSQQTALGQIKSVA